MVDEMFCPEREYDPEDTEPYLFKKARQYRALLKEASAKGVNLDWFERVRKTLGEHNRTPRCIHNKPERDCTECGIARGLLER